MNNTTYYVIYTNECYSSRHNVQPQVMIKTADEIINAADCELCKRGESLYELAGIKVNCPARALTLEEEFELSIRALKHDGRLFHVFKTDSEGEKNFINEARYYRIEDEARGLINKIKLESIIF